MDLGLRDKIAVITGGSTGIGLAVAEGLAGEGVQLMLCARNEERLQQAVESLSGKYEVRVLGVRADVTRPTDIDSLAKRVGEEYGGVDILINNAGTGSEETIMQAPDERWQYYWDLHVMAAVRLSRALVPFMRTRGGGVILNNASVCAKEPLEYEPIYNVTKAALVMLSKCLANELVGDNIRVNAVSPGPIMTPDWKKTATLLGEKEGITWEEYVARLAAQSVPMHRFASPEEAANLFVFLVSSRASFCTGSTYYVDGGYLKVIT